MRHTVRKEFADYLLAEFPELKSSPDMRGVFRYIAFYNWFDTEPDEETGEPGTNRLILHWKTIMKSCAVYDPNKFHLEGILLEMKKIWPDLAWTGYSEGHSRQLISSGFSQELQKKIDEEMAYSATKTGGPDRVNLLSLRQSTSRTDRQIILDCKDDCKDIVAERQEGMSEEAKFIQQHMNKKASAAFTLGCIKRNGEAAVSLISQIPEQHKRQIQLRIMTSMTEVPQIVYAPSEKKRSCRLYAQGDAMTALKKEVRKVLTKGYWEVDFESSQFCILARVLRSKPALALIASGKSIWTELQESFGLRDQKGPLKKLVYSMVFGMSIWNLRKILRTARITEDVLDHPIMADLLKKRERWYAFIEKQGGLHDCWGVWHALSPETDTEKARHPGSVGATLIQSIELDIVYAAFELIDEQFSKNYETNIQLFQHDGLTMNMSNLESERKISMRKISEAIADRAMKKHEVTMRVEFNQL